MKVTGEAFDKQDQQAAKVAMLKEELEEAQNHMATEVATLKEEVKEQRDSRIRMEGILTYVED